MLIASFTAILLAAAAPEMMIPPGTILPVILNETLNTAKVQDNECCSRWLTTCARAVTAVPF